MSVYVLALLIGVVAGLRTMTAPAVVSWAAYFGRVHLEGTWLAFLGCAWTPYILSAFAIAELVSDQLPKTRSRKVPIQFGARIVTGALCGTTLRASGGTWMGGLVADAIGAVGPERSPAMSFGRGWWRRPAAGTFPIALLEDAVAIGGAILIVMSFS
jgi:uncharacterized membrane protein